MRKIRFGGTFSAVLCAYFSLFLLSNFTSADETVPKKYAIIIGDGQLNSNGPQSVKIAGAFLQSNNYDVNFIADSNFDTAMRDFSPDKKRAVSNGAIISELQSLSGKVHKGDQVLIYFSVHGAQRLANEISHSVEIANNNFSLDLIKSYLDKFSQQGAVTGLIDASCFSGGSLALANNNTCVITGAGRDEEGFASFDTDFWGAVKANQTLEETFLRARGQYGYISSPEISSPIGMETQSRLSDISEFLALSNPDNLSTYYNIAGGSCPKSDPIPKVISDLLSKNQDVLTATYVGTDNFSTLKKTVTDYGSYLAKLKADGIGPKEYAALSNRKIKVRYADGHTESYPWIYFKHDFDGIIKSIRNIMGADYDGSPVENFEQERKTRDDLASKNTVFRSYLGEDPHIDSFIRMRELLPVVAPERDLYNRIYMA